MVGTRSGISTTVSAKKEKTKMKTKNVKKKRYVSGSNKHGVRVRGMRPSDSAADGKSGGAIAGSSVPPANHSLPTVRKAILEKAALSIANITRDVSSSSSSEERAEDTAVVAEEDHGIVSPLESPHVLIQGNLVILTRSDIVRRIYKR